MGNSRLFLGLIHTGRVSRFAHKFACKPFDVACNLCEHSHSLQHVARCSVSCVNRALENWFCVEVKNPKCPKVRNVQLSHNPIGVRFLKERKKVIRSMRSVLIWSRDSKFQHHCGGAVCAKTNLWWCETKATKVKGQMRWTCGDFLFLWRKG